MSGLPSNPLPSFVKRNPHIYNLPALTADEKQALAALDKPKKRIRQSSKPLMNPLEKEWFDELYRRHPSYWFLPQAVKFRLGNGIVYTPDIFNFSDFIKPWAWEVKGKYAHRGGFENLKVAASMYPRIRWTLVWKMSGQWQMQDILS